MISFAFINEKGGSGKTTLAVNIASYFALYKNQNVLLIDMDPQGQSGKALGLNVRDLDKTVFEAITEEVHPRECIYNTDIDKLSILPSNKSLIKLPIVISNSSDRDLRLRKIMSKLKKYDLIIIDSPPSLGLMSFNVMAAAKNIIIPVSLTYLAMDGTAEIIDTVNTLKEINHLNDLSIFMMIPTMYRNTRLANDILNSLKKHFPKSISNNIVPMNVKIDEAQSYGKTIWEYSPKSKGAKVIKDIAEEIWQKAKKKK